eukprot:TRINITY_DN9912_c0_g1_i4.p1 TRINITY_DN9912_c0_g1~~TRINITY_DN9912_c0_g1_i4.p1  ORF type:complete len:267 (-),score=47.02 TRINITY_DN9912_c0_g1_i4:80-880(-)
MTFPRNIILRKNPRRNDASYDWRTKSRDVPNRKKSNPMNIAQISSNMTIQNAEKYKFPVKKPQPRTYGGPIFSKYTEEARMMSKQRIVSNVFLTNLSYDESLIRDINLLREREKEEKDEILPTTKEQSTRKGRSKKNKGKPIRISISEDQAIRRKKKKPELYISFTKHSMKEIKAPTSEKEKFFRVQTKEMTPWEGYDLKPSFGVKKSLWAQTMQAYLCDNPKALAEKGIAAGTIFQRVPEKRNQLPKIASPKRSLNTNYFNLSQF